MKFINRLGYYLGGFSVGLIVLAFFLSGKNFSCDYGPNARTVKNIASKKKWFSEEVKLVMQQKSIDSTVILELIRRGDVNFSKSDTKADSCRTYFIENNFKEEALELEIKNCDSIAKVISIRPLKD